MSEILRPATRRSKTSRSRGVRSVCGSSVRVRLPMRIGFSEAAALTNTSPRATLRIAWISWSEALFLVT